LGREHVDQRLVLRRRRALLLRPAFFLQQLVDELVVGRLQHRRRRLRRLGLQLRRDLGVLDLGLVALVGQRRQRDVTATLRRLRTGLRGGFLLFRFARGVRCLVALGLLGGRLVDLLRLADLVELGLLVFRRVVFLLRLRFRIGGVCRRRKCVSERETSERGANYEQP